MCIEIKTLHYLDIAKILYILKVAFFQNVRCVFQISKKKLLQITILNLKFKIPANNSPLSTVSSSTISTSTIF